MSHQKRILLKIIVVIQEFNGQIVKAELFIASIQTVNQQIVLLEKGQNIIEKIKHVIVYGLLEDN